MNVAHNLRTCKKGELYPQPNPTIVSYYACNVKIYKVAGSLVRFENIFFFFFQETLCFITTPAMLL
jgi:hypothetical protein